MLAESKCRKLKWSSDPQNITWVNDKNKFGLKMMKLMGWEEGESLGRDGTGVKKHIEVKPVVENRGLGYKPSACLESQHQPDFEEILQSLNKRYSKTDGIKDPTDQPYFPIERGAAKSRPLRYKKFVQSKDLSRKSSEELSCVFVKRKHSKESLTGATNILAVDARFVEKGDCPKVVGSEHNSFESTKENLTLKPTDATLDSPILSNAPCCYEEIEQIGCRLQGKQI